MAQADPAIIGGKSVAGAAASVTLGWLGLRTMLRSIPDLLVAGEIAVALVLLVGGGLVVKAFWR